MQILHRLQFCPTVIIHCCFSSWENVDWKKGKSVTRSAVISQNNMFLLTIVHFVCVMWIAPGRYVSRGDAPSGHGSRSTRTVPASKLNCSLQHIATRHQLQETKDWTTQSLKCFQTPQCHNSYSYKTVANRIWLVLPKNVSLCGPSAKVMSQKLK